jgi:hypothetical protein
MHPDLLRIASRVVWWEPPSRVVARETDFLCRVMVLGTWEDANQVEDLYGPARLRIALAHAPAGVFDPRSWHYWHHRLGLGPASPLPARRIT